MRLDEINSRLAAISKEAENEGADLDALTREADALIEERDALNAAGAKRTSLLSKIASGEIGVRTAAEKPEQKPVTMTREEALASKEYRNFFAKTLMNQPTTAAEQMAARTAGVALTTTATTYVGADGSHDGVNNGGLFIPAEINLALVREAEAVSPIFRDCAKDNLPGILKFPYKVSGTGASVQVEGVDNTDGQIQWAELELAGCEISETIRVSWKLERMAVESFLAYLSDELVEAVRDTLINQVIYGTGSSGQMSGATVGGIGSNTYDGTDPLGAIETALAGMAAKKKAGAKIYLSNSAAEKIAFYTDSNDKYNFNVVNGAGIVSIANYPAEVDPYLADGDILIGNVRRFYRLNTIEQISVTKDFNGKKRASDYTAYGIFGGAAQPSSLCYIQKTTN